MEGPLGCVWPWPASSLLFRVQMRWGLLLHTGKLQASWRQHLTLLLQAHHLPAAKVSREELLPHQCHVPPDVRCGKLPPPPLPLKGLLVLSFPGWPVSALPSILAAADPDSCPDSGGCCLEYSKRPISLNRLVSYEYANSNCPLPAVIFITKLKKRICADPKADWTKQRVRHLPSPTN
ncbi:hypothetical protein JRQ81_008224 [Phrynocephalus forsythii]|uniref:C-C motif chemokine n=1 Tax=Phrynocephalus forsythii TaxID=171643 RepID=A0A9Q0XDJ1_9SAUR|nr:hypothetical protein JRQ81_008224 [Phrynocephalus forsythii]